MKKNPQPLDELKQLRLLDQYVLDLCACAADPTEDKINEFHGKYNEAKRQEIKESVHFQTWGDTKIFADGEAILQKIGAGALLDEVREDLKKAVIDHFMADFLDCAKEQTAEKMAEFYNDYNNKFVHIGKIIDDPELISCVKSIFDKMYKAMIEAMANHYGGIHTTNGIRNLTQGKALVAEIWLRDIFYELQSDILIAAAAYLNSKGEVAALRSIKKTATNAFMRDFISIVSPTSCRAIRDFYSQYKMTYLNTIINDQVLVENIKVILQKIEALAERQGVQPAQLKSIDQQLQSDIDNTVARNFMKDFLTCSESSTKENIADFYNKYHCGRVFHDMMSTLFAGNRLFINVTSRLFAIIDKLERQTNDIDPALLEKVLPKLQSMINITKSELDIKSMLSSLQERDAKFTEKVIVSSHKENDREQEKKDTKVEIVETQTNAVVANTSNQAESSKVEKQGSFTEKVTAERSNENGKGGPAL